MYAKKRYSPFSDIDLVIITNIKVSNKFFIYKSNKQHNTLEIGKDIKISIFSKTKNQAIKAALDLNNLSWPTEAGMFLNILSVYDPSKFFASLLSEYNKIKTRSLEHTKFKNLASKWLSVAYEFLTKISAPNISLELTRIYGKEFCFCISNFIKSINMDFFLNIYKFIDESKQSNIKPKNCHVLMCKILNSSHTEIIRVATKELWKNTINLSQKQNIIITTYSKNQMNKELITLFHD